MKMTVPYPYQIEGVRGIQRFGGRAILADVMGLGKTLQSLLWSKTHLRTAGPVVVVCPASVKWNWQREAAKHLGMRAEVLSGRTPPPRTALSADGIWIVNYDILGTSVTKNTWLKALRRRRPSLVICDEAHMLKSRTAKRTKAVQTLCKDVPHVLLLTGTPMTNRPAELFPLLNLVRPDVFDSFMAYAMEFCQPEKKPWGWEYKGAKNVKGLHALLYDTCMIRRLKKDVLKELPDKTRSVVPVELSDWPQYRKAEADFLAWLKETHPKKMTAARKAERLMRMGYLRRLVGELKVPAVGNWIDTFLESGEKLLAFAVHKKVLKPLHARFGARSVLVDGSVAGEDRQKAFDSLQKDPACRLFLGNLIAAGVGWTGTAASSVAHVEFDWTPAAHAQATDRVHRIGQTRGVVEYWLVARGTVEEDLAEILQAKQGVLDAVLEGAAAGPGEDVFDLLENRLLKKGKK